MNAFYSKLISRGSFKILALVLLLMYPLFTFSAVRYVKWNASGSNNGTSWANAYTSLQTALTAAVNGDQIWVAQGTYKPTTGSSRTISFVMKNGVAIYGGFAGAETLLSQRNWASNVTILSGDIGTIGNKLDNTLTLVVNYDNGLTSTSILDGFTLKDAYYQSALDVLPVKAYATAIFNFQVNPTITNCTFEDLFFGSITGGSMNYVNIQEDTSLGLVAGTAIIDHCTFIGNKNDGNFNYGSPLHSNINTQITYCKFINFNQEQATFNQISGIEIGNATNLNRPSINVLVKNSSLFNTDLFIYPCSPGINLTYEENTHINLTKGGIYSSPLSRISVGIGLNCNNSNTVTVKNSTIWNQCAYNSIMLSANDILNVSYSNLSLLSALPPTNITDEPHVVLKDGNLDFLSSSPGINIGNNGGAYALDLKDLSRIYNTTVDMGAYELQSNTSAQIANITSVSGVSSGLSTATVTAVGGGPGTYKWYNLYGQLVATGNPAVLAVSQSMNLAYFVRVENGTSASDLYCFSTVYCALPPAPTSLTTTASSFCVGGSATLTVSGGSGTYFWFADSCGSTPIASNVNSIVVNPSTTTTYYVATHNACGYSACLSQTISVYPIPVAPTGATSDTICQGSTASLSVNLPLGSTVSWYNNSAGTGAALSTSNPYIVAPSSLSTYYAFSNNGNCKSATGLAVTVHVNPIPASPTGNNSYSICQGESVTLSVNPPSGNTVEWYNNSAGSGNPLSIGNTYTVSPNSTTTYYAFSVNTSHCLSNTGLAVTVTVNLLPIVPTGNAFDTICMGENASLTASAPLGSSVVWYDNALGTGTPLFTGSPYVVSPTSTTTYYAFSNNASNCLSSNALVVEVMVYDRPADPTGIANYEVCGGDSILVSAIRSTGDSLQWYSNGTLVFTGSSFYISPTADTAFTVYAFNGNCLSNLPLNINIAHHDVPTITLINTDPLCYSDNVGTSVAQVSGGQAPYSYTWSNNETDSSITVSPGTYYITVTDQEGCKNTDSLTITTAQSMSPIILGDDTICQGDSLLLVLQITGAIQITWNIGSGNDSITVHPEQDTWYYASVKNMSGCIETDSMKVFVRKQPSIEIMNPENLCDNEKLIVTAISDEPVTYVWSNGSTDASLQFEANSIPNSLSVTVTNSAGCVNSSTKSPLIQNIYPSPTAAFDTLKRGNIHNLIEFVNHSSADVTKYTWRFGDGATLNDKDPHHTFLNIGIFETTLLVENAFGCKDSASLNVNIIEFIFIPNIFTPNVDGFNDYFYIPLVGFTEFEIVIYNRWGTKVFETTDPGFVWDGTTLNGAVAPDGTYYFLLKGKASKVYNLQGTVTLVR